jgi:hypothetical protein
LLRSASHVLGTAEFFLSAVGALLQGKEGEDLAEVKSLLLQVDQALGSSQCLLMGTLANFTLSKRREILEKSSVNEILQDSLLRSPLSDKVFGLSLQKVQEEEPRRDENKTLVSTESEEFPLLFLSVIEIELPRTEDGTSYCLRSET